MGTFFRILLVVILAVPAIAFAESERNYDYDRHEHWRHFDDERPIYRTHPFGDRDGDERHYYSDEDRRGEAERRKERRERRSAMGWDIDPGVAKRSPNCHHYSLTVHGGKATARIEPLPGTNYVQTHGQRTGYVCFEGSPTLELGKLADPNTEVVFRLRDIGTFVFSRGDKGSRYKNSWYRSYWGL